MVISLMREGCLAADTALMNLEYLVIFSPSDTSNTSVYILVVTVVVALCDVCGELCWGYNMLGPGSGPASLWTDTVGRPVLALSGGGRPFN